MMLGWGVGWDFSFCDLGPQEMKKFKLRRDKTGYV